MMIMPMIIVVTSSSTSTCWVIIDMPIIGFTAITARRSRTSTYILSRIPIPT